jgi:hypothetical protein
MAGFLKVPARVFVFRVVTTTDFAAGHTHPEVYPPVADLQALFTTGWGAGGDVSNLVYVVAAQCLALLLSYRGSA